MNHCRSERRLNRTTNPTLKRRVAAALVALTAVAAGTGIALPAAPAAAQAAATRATAVASWEEKADRVIETGLKYLGAPYRLGANWRDHRAFDCSNFTAHVFREALGMSFTSSSRGQAKLGKPVPRNQIRKGDLLFFESTRRGPGQVGHVAIYMGDDRILHTYRAGIGVTVTRFEGSPWWSSHFLFARRLIED